MICTGLFKSITALFAQMSIVAFVFFVAGLMLLVIEFFQPSYGVAGGCGIALLVAAIVTRMLQGGTPVMLFIMLFMCVSIILILHLISLRVQKKAWLTQALALKLQQTAESDKGETVGKVGVALENLDEEGQVLLDGVTYTAFAVVPVATGQSVRVVQVSGDKILVEPYAGEEE